MFTKLRKEIENIRKAVFGSQVRKAIADGIEELANTEEAHIEDTDNKIAKQNAIIDRLIAKYDEVIASGTENPNMLEIVEAREGYKSLLERLTADQLRDILLGNEDNRLLQAFDSLGELLGTIDNEGFYFSKVSAGDIDCPTIPTVVEGGTYYVDNNAIAVLSENGTEEMPFKSLEHCFEYFKGKISNEDITIIIKAGEYNEHPKITSLLGGGHLTLVLEEGAKLNGGLYFKGIEKVISITGNTAIIQHGGETTKANGAIYFDNCRLGYVTNLQVIGLNNVSDWGIIAYKGSNVFVDSCTISGFNHWGSALSSQYNSKLCAKNCKGSTNNKSIHAIHGGEIRCVGTIPNATTKGNVDELSVMIDNNAVMTNADSNTITPPSNVNPTTTHTVNPSKITSWCGNYGWDLTVGSYEHKLYQGKYYSNYPDTWNWRGFIGYKRTDIANVINNKEIVGIKIQLSRKSVGGNASSVAVRLWGTDSTGTGSAPNPAYDYGTITSIKKGETQYIQLPASAINHIKSGAISGFLLYHPKGSVEVANYAIFETTTGKLQITVR